MAVAEKQIISKGWASDAEVQGWREAASRDEASQLADEIARDDH